MSDEKKLIDIFIDHYPVLTKLAIMIVEDKTAALDVMQNVALIIVKKNYDLHDIDKPLGFLVTCVRRAALNYLRDKARTYPTDPTILEETHSDEYSHVMIDYVEWVATLEKFLSSYSPELQGAFIKHYIDGFSLIDVAKELGMTPNALSQQFRRMRNRIAKKAPEVMMLIMMLTNL